MEPVLSKGDIFDLFSLDDQIRKSCGVGFLPAPVARTFQKIIFCGEQTVDVEELQAAWEQFRTGAYEEVVNFADDEDSSSKLKIE